MKMMLRHMCALSCVLQINCYRSHLGEEDLKGCVEFGWEQEDSPGMGQKAEEEASAEMYLVIGREGNWHSLRPSLCARCWARHSICSISRIPQISLARQVGSPHFTDEEIGLERLSHLFFGRQVLSVSMGFKLSLDFCQNSCSFHTARIS